MKIASSRRNEKWLLLDRNKRFSIFSSAVLWLNLFTFVLSLVSQFWLIFTIDQLNAQFFKQIVDQLGKLINFRLNLISLSLFMLHFWVFSQMVADRKTKDFRFFPSDQHLESSVHYQPASFGLCPPFQPLPKCKTFFVLKQKQGIQPSSLYWHLKTQSFFWSTNHGWLNKLKGTGTLVHVKTVFMVYDKSVSRRFHLRWMAQVLCIGDGKSWTFPSFFHATGDGS